MHEAVPHENNYAKEVAEFFAQEPRLAEPAQRRDYFSNLDGDGFIDLVQRTASLVRTGDSNAMQSFDGRTVGLMTFEVPDHDDKEELLRETWEVARDCLRDPALNDEDALNSAGIIVGAGGPYAHPYKDGNGRTFRVDSYMIAHGYSDSTPDDLEVILSKDGGDEWLIQPPSRLMNTFANRHISVDISNKDWPQHVEWGEEELSGLFDDKLPGNEDDVIDRFKSSGYLNRSQALRIFMDRVDDGGKAVLRKYTIYDEKGEPVSLDAKKALDALVHDPDKGIGYAAQLVEAQRHVRADYIRRFLKAMKQEERLPVDEWEQRITSLERFGERRAEFAEKAKTGRAALGRYAVNGAATPREQLMISNKMYSTVPGHKGVTSE